MRRRRSYPEDDIQRAVADHLRQRAVPGVVWWHTPNGGKRHPIVGAKLKDFGMRAGVSDIIAVHNGRVFALELKAQNGVPSEPQMQFLSDINAAGGSACIAAGVTQAVRVLEIWGLLRGVAA